ncbi:hypothetical protein [Hydrogenophaga sp. RWCD_12]|uniref:hypothetical protein n=1 Tax=Hydrogenophaga sp. RWCD_12 TaxID=3391190 RepID=UPI003984F0A3
MQSYSFSVALRIWHPNIDPEVISQNLWLKAKHAAMARAERTTPKGRKLSGVHAESYWHSDPFERDDYASTDDLAEDILASVVEVLAPKKAFLLLLREQGARLHLQVASFSHRNYAVELSPHFLIACGELGLSVVHDVYPCAQGI